MNHSVLEEQGTEPPDAKRLRITSSASSVALISATVSAPLSGRPCALFAETIESESRQQSAAQADRFCTHKR